MFYEMLEVLTILSNPKFVERGYSIHKSRFQSMKELLAKQQEAYKRLEDMVKHEESENK